MRDFWKFVWPLLAMTATVVGLIVTAYSLLH